MDIECKMHKCRVHNERETALALLDDGVGEDRLVVSDGGVVAVSEVSLEIRLGCGRVAEGWSTGGEDAM